MARIKESDFTTPDPNDPRQSMTEFDLAARLGLTIHKRYAANLYCITGIKDRKVHYASRSLQRLVDIANDLEGHDYIEYVGPA